MSDRDPLLAILRGLHDALAQLADTTHWAAARARKILADAEVDRLLREQEKADQALQDHPQIRDAGSRAPGGVTASEGDDSMNGYSAHGASNGVKRDATSGPETTSSQGIIASDAEGRSDE